jgi:ELWxxDGT repeat protein
MKIQTRLAKSSSLLSALICDVSQAQTCSLTSDINATFGGSSSDISKATADGLNTEFAEAGGRWFFSASAGPLGKELWSTDGTKLGTTMASNINQIGSSTPFHLEEHGGLLYFSADDGPSGEELWRSDGTPDGTLMVADLNPGGGGL